MERANEFIAHNDIVICAVMRICVYVRLISNSFCKHHTLTRLSPRELILDGRWTRKSYGLSRVHPIYVSVSLLRDMSILFLNILPLLAPTQSADNAFDSVTLLCENENFMQFRAALRPSCEH